jgi:serine protease Do
MNKNRTSLRSLILVFAGIAAGALIFSNVEFTLSGAGSMLGLSSRPNLAKATDTIQNHPIRTLSDFNEAFVRIAESATPSVVTIFTETTVSSPSLTPFDFFGRPFDEFFNFPHGRRENGRKEVLRGLGSGVIVSSDGYILTNNHVIDKADAISIRTFDNRKIQARIVGKDPKTDLAVIKVNAGGLKPIVIGNSDRLRVGEWVIAIGSPLGENLARTVTQGIVSAKGRANVGLADYEDFIQTDAAINPGNSGGALVNINGELVGINTAIASRTGGFEGIGFAVPSNMAQKVLTSLVRSGKVTRGYLGVSIQDIDENIAKGLQLRTAQGVLVGTVISGGPAAKAGMKTGDIVLEFNDRKMENSAELRNAIASFAPGTTVKLKILREGAQKVLSVRLEELPDRRQAAVEEPSVSAGSSLGFSASSLNAKLAERFRMKPDVSKVVVAGIDPSGSAYKAGLRTGDIILSVDRKPVSSLAQFTLLVKNKKAGELLFLLVERAGSRIYFAFNL